MPSACLADIVRMSYDKKEYDVIIAAAEKSAVTHLLTLLLVILLLLVICFVIVIVKSKNVKAASSEQSGGNKKSFIKGIICVILFVFVIAATGILYSYDFVARWHYGYLSTNYEGLHATPPCVSGKHEWEVVATERHTHKCKKCRLIQKESGCRVDGGRLGIIDHSGCQVEVSSAISME